VTETFNHRLGLGVAPGRAVSGQRLRGPGGPRTEPGWQAGSVLIEHRGESPTVHPSAYVAPTAVLCGAVHVGPEARILFGAVLTAEDGAIEVGARCVVMENAVLRGRARHPLVLGDDVLVGPHAHLNGARIGDGCFLATGAALFPGAELGPGSEVRIRGVVQVNTVLPAGSTVPIAWVAVGNPAQIYPPGQHEQIWAVQEGLNFPGTVYGVSRDTPATERMARQANWFSAHRDDRLLDGGMPGGNGGSAS
jgi:carbonic anhydrase/acetyltransferase-like protein (isoleucine patch superfamily)